ncbi:MAG: heat-inducible transcriptional repressor HrcA [Deltaproteobacteria bacterium]|nr:heat-inducible transcriptional repressor HrcA [Deltaproteobacteria bacterium]MDL1960321.1 heat-inducible transcriptional repressor HrcA [Deltaproteobacteria bacterium]
MDTKHIDLSERSREILKTIIHAYINSAEPVGSRTVSKKAGLGLSPATIRNAMADLEDIGLLFQPHSSAGRLPTETGLRYYLDFLLEKEDLSWGDQVAIEKGLMFRPADLVLTLKRAVQILASFSGHAAVVSVPRLTCDYLIHLEFLRIRPGLILVISVSDTGMVQNRLVQIDYDIPEEKLEQISQYLSSKLVHMCLEELRSVIIEELKEEKRVFDVLLEDFLDQMKRSTEQGEVFIEGKLNFLDKPEFSNVSRIRAILQTFEEKEALLTLLDRCLDSRGVQIYIGSEGLGNEMPACGMVLAPYAGSDSPLGSLGIVGPIRMNYARAVSLVEYTAQVLGEKFKES